MSGRRIEGLQRFPAADDLHLHALRVLEPDDRASAQTIFEVFDGAGAVGSRDGLKIVGAVCLEGDG